MASIHAEQTRLSAQQPTMSYADTDRSIVPMYQNSAGRSIGRNSGIRGRAITNYTPSASFGDGPVAISEDYASGSNSPVQVQPMTNQHRSDDKSREVEVMLQMPPSVLEQNSNASQPLRWVSNVFSRLDQTQLECWTKLQNLDEESLNHVLAPCGPDHPYSLLRDANAMVSMGEWGSSSRSSSNSSSHSAAEIIVNHPDRAPTRVLAAPGDRVIIEPRNSETPLGSGQRSFEDQSFPPGTSPLVPDLRNRERQLLSTVSSHVDGGPSAAGARVTCTETMTHSQLSFPTHGQTISTFSDQELADLISKLAEEGKIIIPDRQDSSAIAHGSLQSEADGRVSDTYAGRHVIRSDIPGVTVSSNTGSAHPDVHYILPDSSLLSRGSEGPASSVPGRRFQGQPMV